MAVQLPILVDMAKSDGSWMPCERQPHSRGAGGKEGGKQQNTSTDPLSPAYLSISSIDTQLATVGMCTVYCIHVQ